MEPKLVRIEFVPAHPKLMRLPSVSRSLHHSILPRACQQMYRHPRIYISCPPMKFPEGKPNLSLHSRTHEHPIPHIDPTTVNKRPITGSYIYRKLFNKPVKSHPRPTQAHRLSRTKETNRKKSPKVNYYCEILPPQFREPQSPTCQKTVKPMNFLF